MATIRRKKVYLTPQDAERFSGLSREALAQHVRRGLLTHYRTAGNHRRYDVDELRKLKSARQKQCLNDEGEL